jgi:hypothetical protein
MTLPPGGLPTPATPPRANVRYRDLRASLLIGLCCLVVYNANLRSISAGDTYPARYLPFAIVQYHTIFFDPIARVAAQGRGAGAYWMLPRPDGHILSLYPVVLPVLVAPLYVPAVGYLHFKGWTDARLDRVARVMEKLTASFLAALSAALLYLLLRRRAKGSIALLLTLAYAFGTTTWTISSQALWQHGMAELLVIAALLLLTAPCTAPRTLAAGLLLGLIAGNRPPDVILGAALGVYALFWVGSRGRAVLLAAASALPMVVVLLYNLHTAGNVGGGYGVIGTVHFFEHPLLPGMAGLLVSPTRGLLVFCPFLLFLALAYRHRPQLREERLLTLCMSVAVILQLMLYAKVDWRSGLSWGPRYMTDLLPLLIWMLVPVVAALRGVGRVSFLAAVGIAVVLEAIGAFSYSFSLDLPIYAADLSLRDDMRGAWQWQNAPYITSVKHGLMPAELASEMRGNFEAVLSGGHPTNALTAGQEAFVTGWALAGDATPFQVAVSIDGKGYVSTVTFVDRPDVRQTLHTASLSGWRIPLDTAALAPGQHHLTALAWSSGKGEGHFLEERTLTVRSATGSIAPPAGAASPGASAADVPADLHEDFQRAIARLREHQQAPGYWLTSFTKEPRFQEPRPEMNTFLTALLVDLLDPLAATSGLEENLQRARRHLTSQIESGGLVRYHGLPNGPGIGTLGCAITPDTDNTALVWRLAPAPDRGRLTTALATIDRYRTREGLYRTWLAPRDAYQCLDPGSDPDPADIAIQMHLLLLLAEVRPPAGRALCQALRPLVDDDRIWVYYRKSPLVPMLRLPDLHRAGCDLTLPESRMHTDVPDQQIWVSVVRLLTTPESSPPDPVLIRAVLRELARDDFALIRRNPPLLYHNDLTATVARYYWSEDAGYALWLRLYDQYAHPHDARPGI